MAEDQTDRHGHGDHVPALIELEAQALRDLTDTVTQWVAEDVGTSPRHILDLGSGTGAGTFALLATAGWFVVVEAEDVPWYLPEDPGTGRPGLERRCHELPSAHRAAQLPDVGSDWGYSSRHRGPCRAGHESVRP